MIATTTYYVRYSDDTYSSVIDDDSTCTSTTWAQPHLIYSSDYYLHTNEEWDNSKYMRAISKEYNERSARKLDYRQRAITHKPRPKPYMRMMFCKSGFVGRVGKRRKGL